MSIISAPTDIRRALDSTDLVVFGFSDVFYPAAGFTNRVFKFPSLGF